MKTTVRKHLEVSVFSILNQLKVFFVVAFGILFFKEAVIPLKILGVVLVFLGNYILLYKKGGKIKLDKYILLAILAAFVFAIAISIDIGISPMFNLPIYISITLLLPLLILFVFERHSIKTVLNEFNQGKKLYFIITGLSWGLVTLFTLRAYRFGDVTTVAPLLSLSVLLNVLVASFFLKERKGILQKVIAAIVVMLGAYLTVIGNK